MRRGRLICLTGIDGSGKTTLSMRLVEAFRSKGIASRYIYGRHTPFVVRPFMLLGRLLFFRKDDMYADYAGYSGKKREATMRHRGLAGIYLNVLLMEYYLQLLFRISLPLMFRKQTLVVDRYIVDTVVTDLAVDFNLAPQTIRELLGDLHARFPVPDMLILIDTPEEVAFKRKTDTPSLEYLRERRSLYLQAAADLDAVVVDGSLPLEEVWRSVASLAVGEGGSGGSS